jgi:chemotaxis protein CheD
MKTTVGVSDLFVSNKCGDIIVTHALGSCIGLAIHDPKACVGGLLHYMLPLSKIDNSKSQVNPYMFGDSGIPELFQQAYKLGAKKENIQVVMAGGADILNNCNYFNIGARNIAIARKMFWKNSIMITAEQTGGTIPRTMYLEIGSGKSWITSHGEKTDLM